MKRAFNFLNSGEDFVEGYYPDWKLRELLCWYAEDFFAYRHGLEPSKKPFYCVQVLLDLAVISGAIKDRDEVLNVIYAEPDEFGFRHDDTSEEVRQAYGHYVSANLR